MFDPEVYWGGLVKSWDNYESSVVGNEKAMTKNLGIAKVELTFTNASRLRKYLHEAAIARQFLLQKERGSNQGRQIAKHLNLNDQLA